MKDKLLLITPVGDVDDANEMYESFKNTSIGYAEGLLVLEPSTKANYPTGFKWHYAKGSYGEKCSRAIHSLTEPYRIYLLASGDTRWAFPAWDYRLKEIFDDNGDLCVVDVGCGVAFAHRMLGEDDLPDLGREGVWDRMRSVGESFRRLYAYPWMQVKEEEGGVVEEA